jgi:hypothetical protein
MQISWALIRPEATYGAEWHTLDKDIPKRLTAFERKVLKIIFRGINVNENWRKLYIQI